MISDKRGEYLKKRHILLGFLVLLLAGGCQKMENKTKQDIQNQLTREEVKLEILTHLKTKYNRSFESQSLQYKSWAQKGHESMYAYPEGENPNKNFVVYRYDNGKKYEDGYVGFIMEPVYQKKIEQCVLSYFPHAVVRSGFDSRYIYPESFKPDMDFTTFDRYKNKKNSMGTGIFLAAKNESEISQELLNSLEKELKEIYAIGGYSITGYSEKEFQQYILNDPFDSIEKNTSFSNTGETFSITQSWGKIDFDYSYKEGD